MQSELSDILQVFFFFLNYYGFLSTGGANPRFQGLRLSAVHGGAGAELQGRRSHRHERHLQRGGVTTELLWLDESEKSRFNSEQDFFLRSLDPSCQPSSFRGILVRGSSSAAGPGKLVNEEGNTCGGR